MRLDRAKAYLIDLLVIFVIYSFFNTFMPQNDNLKKYKSEEREIQEKFNHQEMSVKEYMNEYQVVYYEINYERRIYNIGYLVLLIIYFVVLPYVFNGQTLGLFINKLRVERFTDGKLKLYQLFIRNVIIVGLGYTFLNTILIFFLKSSNYYKVIFAVSIIQILLLILSWIMVVRKREKRGLHEILSNTEMVSLRKKH